MKWKEVGILKSNANVVPFKEGKETLEKADAHMCTCTHVHTHTHTGNISVPAIAAQGHKEMPPASGSQSHWEVGKGDKGAQSPPGNPTATSPDCAPVTLGWPVLSLARIAWNAVGDARQF